MAKLKKIKDFIDEELKIAEVEDVSNNGLQVEGKKEIKKIAFAVDACRKGIAYCPNNLELQYCLGYSRQCESYPTLERISPIRDPVVPTQRINEYDQ